MCEFIYKRITVLICISLCAATSFQDSVITPCGNCTCMGREASADCSNRNLKNIPIDLPANTTDLNLARNLIGMSSQIKGLLCQKYPGLTKVSLAWNGIETLAHILQGCKHLQHLDLTGNVLAFPSSSDFEDLQNLKEISSIEVEELHLDTFQSLKQLESLNLTIYGITIKPGVFSGLLSLRRLTLALEKVLALPEQLFSFHKGNVLTHLIFQGSKVKDIPDDFLDELADLMELHLDLPQILELKIQSNRKPKYLQVLEISNVRSLEKNILIGLNYLERVKLYGINNLAGDDLFKTAKTLKELEIVECSLTKIPAGWFHNMGALETLNLSENGLEKLSPVDFLHLTSLKHLILSNNKIDDLSSNFLDSVNATLMQLLLNGNQLKTLEPEAFTDLEMLEVLDLRKNTIRTIASNSFRNLPLLKILQLSGNYISSLDNVMFESFPMLRDIDLAENIISQFPESLLESKVVFLLLSANNLQKLPGRKMCEMQSLQSLGLEDNPILCDCSVRALHKCLPLLQIQGQCSKPADMEGLNIDEVTQCDESVDMDIVATPSLPTPSLVQSTSSLFVSTSLSAVPSMMVKSISSTNIMTPALSTSASNMRSASLTAAPSMISASLTTPNLISATLTSAPNLLLPTLTAAPNLLSAPLTSAPNRISAPLAAAPSTLAPSVASPSLIPAPSVAAPSLIPAPLVAAPSLIPAPLVAAPSLIPAPLVAAPSLIPAPLVAAPSLIPASLAPVPNLLSASLPSVPNVITASLTTAPILIASESLSPASSLWTSSSTSSLKALTHTSPTPSLALWTTPSTAPRVLISNRSMKKLAVYYDDGDDGSQHDEIVRPLIATEIFENHSELLTTSDVEELLATQSAEMFGILSSDLVNVSDIEEAMNEQENDSNSMSPDMVHVAAVINETSFWIQAWDITIAFLISLAVMAGIVAGLWLYRKTSQSGSYNPVSPPLELPPVITEEVPPAVAQQSTIINQKESDLTLESVNHESAASHESVNHESANYESVNHESVNQDPY